MEALVALLQDHPWWSIVAAVVALASAITAITPTPDPNSTLGKLYKVVEYLALIVGKAKDTGEKVDGGSDTDPEPSPPAE